MASRISNRGYFSILCRKVS